MHNLSLFLGLLTFITPSFAAVVTRSVPLYNYGGQVQQDSYIVKVKDNANKNDILALVSSLVGGDSVVTHNYDASFYNAFAGNFGSNVIAALLSSAGVEYVAQNGHMSAFDSRNDEPWGLARISTRNKLSDQNPNHLSFTYNYKSDPRSGVDIYVVDTGIYTDHEDFGGRAKWGHTFCNGCPDKDDNGHGTHVSGTAGGTKFGVAKSANLIAVKVLDADGSGQIADIISGLQWVRDQYNATGRPSIATMSLGGGFSKPMNDAVKVLVKAGVHCTVAAGNSNEPAELVSPASTSEAITVGASEITDAIALYSNFGSVVDLYAPGSNVISTWNNGTTSTNTLSGTSMATPHVAGLVAYFIQTVGQMNPQKMSDYIKSLATTDALCRLGTMCNPAVLPFKNLLAYNGIQ